MAPCDFPYRGICSNKAPRITRDMLLWPRKGRNPSPFCDIEMVIQVQKVKVQIEQELLQRACSTSYTVWERRRERNYLIY